MSASGEAWAHGKGSKTTRRSVHWDPAGHQSRSAKAGPQARCLRLIPTVTRHGARLASSWWLTLAGWDCLPPGSEHNFINSPLSVPKCQDSPGALSRLLDRRPGGAGHPHCSERPFNRALIGHPSRPLPPNTWACPCRYPSNYFISSEQESGYLKFCPGGRKPSYFLGKGTPWSPK